MLGKGKPECYVKEPSTPNAHVPNEVEPQQALSLHVGCAPGGPPALEPRGVGAPVPRLVNTGSDQKRSVRRATYMHRPVTR